MMRVKTKVNCKVEWVECISQLQCLTIMIICSEYVVNFPLICYRATLENTLNEDAYVLYLSITVGRGSKKL